MIRQEEKDLILTCHSPLNAIYDMSLTKWNLSFKRQIIVLWAQGNYFQKVNLWNYHQGAELWGNETDK